MITILLALVLIGAPLLVQTANAHAMTTPFFCNYHYGDCFLCTNGPNNTAYVPYNLTVALPNIKCDPAISN